MTDKTAATDAVYAALRATQELLDLRTSELIAATHEALGRINSSIARSAHDARVAGKQP